MATRLYVAQLRSVVQDAPQLTIRSEWETESEFPRVAVIVPAYNEAENIRDCLLSILNSTSLSAERLTVWMVDDQSTDATWTIAQSLHDQLNDDRLLLLAGQPKPTGQVWVGKNWACVQAAEQATADYLLFLDADVRLRQGAIETVVQAAQHEQIDLLSALPAITCGCLAEWLVQPLMLNALLMGSPFKQVNDPASEKAFAAGPFMLFRRTAYDQIGGHRAVADQVVEDVELARLLKSKQMRLTYLSGSNLADVRMYRSASALWEGWTKNLYLGARRQLNKMLYFAAIMVVIFPVPWIGLLVCIMQLSRNGLDGLTGVSTVLAVSLIAMQYQIRRMGRQLSAIPPRYWWLTGVGGLAIAAIVLGSIIKTETGWGWTWRGRSLKDMPLGNSH